MIQRAADLLKPMPLIPYVRAHLGAVFLKSMFIGFKSIAIREKRNRTRYRAEGITAISICCVPAKVICCEAFNKLWVVPRKIRTPFVPSGALFGVWDERGF